MSELREQLREFLDKATAGPYSCDPGWQDAFDPASGHYTREDGSGILSISESEHFVFNKLEDAIHLSRCSPKNIRTLLDELDAKDGLIEQAVRALEPFDSVVDAYNYFLPVMMPELNFPVEGTHAADPGFERVLSEADFRLARSTLSLLKASRRQNREETE